MAPVAALAKVSDVVEERAHDAELEDPAADGRAVTARTLVAVEQPCHRERHVEDVLQVVVRGVAFLECRMLPAIERRQVVVGALERGRPDLRVEGSVYPGHFELHARRIGGLDPVAHVEVVCGETASCAPKCATCCFCCPWNRGQSDHSEANRGRSQGPLAACQD